MRVFQFNLVGVLWVCFSLLFFACRSSVPNSGADSNSSIDGSDSGGDSNSGNDSDLDDVLDTSDIFVGEMKDPGIKWVRIESGSFVYGSPEDAPCRAAYTENQSNVTLTRSFFIAATEVTQKQWEDVGLKLPPQEYPGDDTPVTLLSYYELLHWMNALSRLEDLETCFDLSSCSGGFAMGCPNDALGQKLCSCNPDYEGGCAATPEIYACSEEVHKYANYYECPGYRLPTTAEWEYAARAGTTTHTYNGDLEEWHITDTDYEEKKDHNFQILDPIAWYKYNSDERLHPVAQKQSNAWGLYDILGNAWEWVDYFSDGQPLDLGDGHPGEDLIDPVGPLTGYFKEIRGGYFSEFGCETRAARQYYGTPDERTSKYGFRPVRTIFE
jgi:formylglycine-generating enzyme required for sulfatase activity